MIIAVKTVMSCRHYVVKVFQFKQDLTYELILLQFWVLLRCFLIAIVMEQFQALLPPRKKKCWEFQLFIISWEATCLKISSKPVVIDISQCDSFYNNQVVLETRNEKEPDLIFFIYFSCKILPMSSRSVKVFKIHGFVVI